MADAVYQAMQQYFSKIKSPSYFELFIHGLAQSEPARYAQVMRGEYLIPRGNTPDFDEFTQKYGFSLPEALRTYYSVYHPPLMGDHPKNPHRSETFMMNSVLRPGFHGLFRDMDFWAEYDPQRQYIPIGSVTYNDSFLLYKRDTGQIFVEFPLAEDPADDEDGKLWEEPLSDSLAAFITELIPYSARTEI